MRFKAAAINQMKVITVVAVHLLHQKIHLILIQVKAIAVTIKNIKNMKKK
jgi:hypothetical protein